jgi:hypothetical protein
MLSAVLAMPSTAAAEWIYASSPHFEVFTTANARRARDTLHLFEQMRAFFASHLGLTPPDGRLVRLIAFSNEEEFRPYRINDAAGAYYRPGADRDYIVTQALGAGAEAVLVHEYVHLLLARSGGRYPVWLNEGLAEYFATLETSAGLATIGRAPESRWRALRWASLLSLDRLFAVTRDSPEYTSENPARVFYAQSWALTHLLLTDAAYRAGADRVLSMVRAGTPSASAMTAVYGKSVAEVLADLADYIRADRFVTRTVEFTPAVVGELALTRSVSSFDAALVMANLLAAGREHRAQARAAFEALARQQPDRVALLEAHGAFELSMNRPAQARPLLARAVELGSKDARTRIRLAALLLPRRPAEALATLDPVEPLTPVETFDVLQLRSAAYLGIGDLERARVTAAELARLATSRQQRATAERLLARIATTTP